jgi:hypothetical protein
VTDAPEGPPPIPRPVRPGNWDIVARNAKVAADWAEFANRAAGECQRVFDQLQTDPTLDDGDRQHPLEGAPGRGTFDGRQMRRWQIDVTSGGRVWYFVDDTQFGSGQRRSSGRVIIDAVHFGHPKTTETKPSRKHRPGRR